MLTHRNRCPSPVIRRQPHSCGARYRDSGGEIDGHPSIDDQVRRQPSAVAVDENRRAGGTERALLRSRGWGLPYRPRTLPGGGGSLDAAAAAGDRGRNVCAHGNQRFGVDVEAVGYSTISTNCRCAASPACSSTADEGDAELALEGSRRRRSNKAEPGSAALETGVVLVAVSWPGYGTAVRRVRSARS
jgi:hypothetical protein